MPDNTDQTSLRKKEHIELCLTDEVAFRDKKNGFDNYDFVNYAITEVDLSKISFETSFLTKKIKYPFLISCMTGGTPTAENINTRLAVAANNLNIALGVGSQRQALENDEYHSTYRVIRKNAPGIPILGNIGASQLVQFESFEPVKYLADLIEADAMVIHLNPAQELMQKRGEPDFRGLLKKLKKLVKYLDVPIIVKEVGAGISGLAAQRLLETGVKGIDIAGAGGTTWSGVEILRNNGNSDHQFWDWGLPTSYCIKEVAKLKKKYKFVLIGSGGIRHGFDVAKALAFGADMAASARVILQTLEKSGVDGVSKLIEEWFETVKYVLFLTGSQTIRQLKNNKLIKKENLY